MRDLLLNPSGIKPADIDDSLTIASGQLADVVGYGQEIAAKINRVYFVSCGAGHWHGMNLQWWADRYTKTTEYRTFTSADLKDLDPPKLDDSQTVVVLSSKSGGTMETVEAAEFLKDKRCRKVVFTKSPEAALAQYGDKAFFTGDTTQAFHATFMLMQAFVGGILAARDDWKLVPQLLSSLRAFPAALLAAAQANEERAKQMAARYNDNGAPIYIIGSGPGKLVQYAFGLCVLDEEEFLVRPVDADQFFHSTLEIVTKEMLGPVILIVGEDTSRQQMERVVTFFLKYGPQTEIYDTTKDRMEGIHPDVRAIFAPYLAEAALKPFAFYLSQRLGKSLSERRYMGKVAY